MAWTCLVTATVASLISFLWGKVYLAEELQSLTGTILSLFMLLTGVFGVCLVMRWEEQQQQTKPLLDQGNSSSGNSVYQSSINARLNNLTIAERRTGLRYAVISGIFGGSVFMVEKLWGGIPV